MSDSSATIRRERTTVTTERLIATGSGSRTGSAQTRTDRPDRRSRRPRTQGGPSSACDGTAVAPAGGVSAFARSGRCQGDLGCSDPGAVVFLRPRRSGSRGSIGSPRGPTAGPTVRACCLSLRTAVAPGGGRPGPKSGWTVVPPRRRPAGFAERHASGFEKTDPEPYGPGLWCGGRCVRATTGPGRFVMSARVALVRCGSILRDVPHAGPTDDDQCGRRTRHGG